MFKKKDSTRLGEILVSKGLITPEQLAIATHEQTKRNRLLNVTDAKAPRGVMIGEILVEFGFIDQLDLKRGLNWQQRLRHVSIAMALCAPFMVFAPTSASAQTTSSSSSSSISTSKKSFSPVTIQAENYSAMKGIGVLDTTDGGPDKFVGNIDTNDWVSYTNYSIDIPTSGNYKITYRVASLKGGGTLLLKEASNEATLDTFSVPKTDGWHNWVTVERSVYLSQGTHAFKLQAGSGGFNINWFKIEMAPTPMPLTIRAENYSSMSGIQTQPTSDQGGGNNISYLDAKDWLAYDNLDVVIPSSGDYKITYRVSSLNGGGKFTLNESSDRAVIDTISVPKTSGWQNWVDVERTVTLKAGTHNFLINIVTAGFNLNWFKIEPIAAASSSSQNIATSSSKSSSLAASSKSSPSSSSQPLASSSSSAAAANPGTSGTVSSSSISAPKTNFSPIIIQAENYASMKGIAVLDTTDGGPDKFVGNIETNDWVSYTNSSVEIPTSGNYKITYRVASLNGGGALVLKEASSEATLDSFSVPKTNGWHNWVDVDRTVYLTQGAHAFKLQAASGGFNINWFKIEAIATTSSSSQAAMSSSSKSSSSAASSKSSSSSSSPPSVSSSSSAVAATPGAPWTITKVKGSVGLSWMAPNQRENGNYLDITEVGGFELRYKQANDANFTYITIKDAWTNQYNFTWLEGDYIFQIAAFDKNGVYSNFVDIRPK